MKRYVLLIAMFSLISTRSFSQTVDKTFIVDQLKQRYSPGAIDSVRVFFVNANYFEDDQKLNSHLSEFTTERVVDLYYSPIKDCGYQPGRGTILVLLLDQISMDDARYRMTRAKKTAKRLFLDDREVSRKEIKNVLTGLRLDDIFDIWQPYDDTNNHTVKIWTKNYAKEKRW